MAGARVKLAGICAAILSVFCLLGFAAGPAAAAGVTATTTSASAVSSQGAELNGMYSNPDAATGYSYYFEYGTTTGYGQQTSQTPLPSNSSQCCYVQVANLTPGTPYHFQLVLVAPDSTQTLGGDQSFTTTASPTGMIYGSVQAAPTASCAGGETSGGPLSGATVTAFPVGSSTPAGSATTSGGSFQITGLAYGSYLVEFSDNGYTTQWYNDQPSASTANPVTVSATGSQALGATLQRPASPCPPSEVEFLYSGTTSPTVTTLSANILGGDTAQVEYGPATSAWCTSGGDTGAPANTTTPMKINSTYTFARLTVSGLASDAAYCGEVTATSAGGTRSSLFFKWQQIAPPVLAVDKIVSTLGTTATVDATLTPRPAASYEVLYGPVSSGFCQGALNASAPHETQKQTVTGSPDWSTTDRVSVTLSGLKNGTIYCAQFAGYDIPLDGYELIGGGSPMVTFTAGATSSSAPTPSQVRAVLSRVLVPSGKAARIAALLKAGGYTLMFHAPSAGVLTIGWYLVPKGATIAKKTKPKAVLVASVTHRLTRAGTSKVKIKLTAQGKKLLKHAKREKLTTRASFAPTGAAKTTTTTTKTITLRR